MTEYSDETFGLEGQRNVVKEIEKILVDLNVVEPYKTRNNVVDVENNYAFWYMRLTQEYLAKLASGDLEIVSPVSSTPSVTVEQFSQEMQELRSQMKQLQQQMKMLLPSDNSLEITSDDDNQKPLDNNEIEISQPVATEETQGDRNSSV